MDTNKNSYTLIYATGMVVIVALLLALVSGALKSKQTANVELDKKKQILSSINIREADNFEEAYDQYITGGLLVNHQGEVISESKEKAFVVDFAKELAKPVEKRELPVYVAQIDGETKYIFSAHGAGLWGEIWGYFALNEDRNTVYGTYISHAGETPGLGAEIAAKSFHELFINKHLMNEQGEFVSIAVVKPGQTNQHSDYVDGISGGTITSKGVEEMLFRSLGQYESFLKQSNNTGGEENE